MTFLKFSAWRSITAMLSLALCLCMFTACSEDDDDEGSAFGSETAGQVTTSEGTTLYITSAGYYDFEYEDGYLVAFDDGEYDYEVTYNPFTITYTYGDPDEDEDYEVCTISNIKLNSSGYITSFSISDVYQHISNSYSDNYDCNGSADFSYDSDGHLLKISVSNSGSVKYINYNHEEYSESYSFSVSITTTNTWDNGLLYKTEYEYSGSEKESGYSEKVQCTDTYEYDTTYPNVTYQFTPNNLGFVGDWGNYFELLGGDFGLLEPLAIIGYLGKGPSYHPTGCESEYAEYEDGELCDDGDASYSYKYDINSDGTVSKSYYKSGSKWYSESFTYSLLSSTRATDQIDTDETQPTMHKPRALFRKMLSRRKAMRVEE